MYRRMLVPLDGSGMAESVLAYAAAVAGDLGLEATLLHVCAQHEDESSPMRRAYIERKAGDVGQKLERARPGSLSSPTVQGKLVRGRPADEILRYSDENDIDLIMMATHGRSGIRRWAMGSIADKVLRASTAPVWLLRVGDTGESVSAEWPPRAIIVPLDGSELAESVLPHVETLAKQIGPLTETVLISICEPMVPPLLYPPPNPIEFEGDLAGCKKANAEYLGRLEQRLRDAGLQARSEVVVGIPADEIVDYDRRTPANLIVMATHGRSGIGRWMFGSVAQKVLAGASSPILLVRPQEDG